jgi:hypothetical protein
MTLAPFIVRQSPASRENRANRQILPRSTDRNLIAGRNAVTIRSLPRERFAPFMLTSTL